MAEIPGVSSKIGADVSGYLQGMDASTEATTRLGDSAKLTQAQLVELANATEAQRAKLLELWQAATDASDGTAKWTDANQRAAMAMSAAQEQALKLNAAMDEGHNSSDAFGEEMLKMVGLGAALGGGMEIAVKGLELLKEATIGSVEEFVSFGHGLDLIHEKLNVPLEVAAAWDQTASVTGMSAERITTSLAMMDQRLATENKQAIEAVNRLGISFTELRDASPDKQMDMLAEATQRFEESGGKADVIIKELMGRGGLGMLPVFQDDMQKLQHHVEEINGPLGQQVKLAEDYEKAAVSLEASWAKIKRTLTEPLVGGLADLMARIEKAGPIALIAPFWGAPTQTQTLTPDQSWQSAMGGLLGEGPSSPTSGPDPYVSQAARTAAAKKAAEEQADYTRRQIEVTKELTTAEAGEATGLNAVIEKIHATTVAKFESIESDVKLSASHKLALEADEERASEAKINSAQIAFARKEEAETAKTALEQENADKKYWADIDKQVAQTVVEDVHLRTAAEEASGRAETEVDGIVAKANEDLAKAHHDKGAAIDDATQKTLAHIQAVKNHIDADKNLSPAEKEMYDRLLDEAAGHEKAAGASQKHAAELKHLATALQETAQLISTMGEAMDEFGANRSAAFKREMEGMTKAAAGAGEAVQGYASGNYVQMVIGIVHFAEGVYQFFHAPETEKIVDEVGKQWGVTISDNLSKAIESTESKDQVSRAMAELLHLDDIMGESGLAPDHFANQIGDLMNAVKLHAVDAAEGIKQLGGAFTSLEQSAAAGSIASEGAMIAMIKRARELKEAIPEIDAFIKQTLGGLGDSLASFFSGQMGETTSGYGWTAKQRDQELADLKSGKITQAQFDEQKQASMTTATSPTWTPQTAHANETILGASFGALASQEGVVKAAEDLQKAFDELMLHVPKDLPLDAGLQHMAEIEELLKDANFKAAAQASADGANAMKALLDTGYLNQETTDAFATSTEGLLQQSISTAIDHGYSPDEARLAGEEANLPMLAQLQHAQELGMKLDPAAQAMLTQAQTDGVLPLKTVAEQQLDNLRQIAANTGKSVNQGAGGGGNGPAGGGEGSGGGGGNNDPGDPGHIGGGRQGYATGGPVEQTGMALVHKGEYVVPAHETGSMGGPSTIVVPISIGGQVIDQYIIRRTSGGWMQVKT